MKQALIVILSIVVGAGAVFFFLQPRSPGGITSIRPEQVRFTNIDVLQIHDFSNVVFEKSEPTAVGVVAVAYGAWDYRVQIGVDFEGFTPKDDLSGFNTPTESGRFLISGTLPPIGIIDAFVVTGSEEQTIIARALGRDENELVQRINSRKASYNECVEAYALSRVDETQLMSQLVQQLQTFMPKTEDDESIVSFNLNFSSRQRSPLEEKFERDGVRKACSAS